MRELTELENWILAVAAKAAEEGSAESKHGMSLPEVLLHRSDLVKILKPANEDQSSGLSWGPEQESELTAALNFLFENDMLVNFDLLAQSPHRDVRQHREIVKLSRRIAKLEGFPAQKEWDVYASFGISPLGQLRLREIDVQNQEDLAGGMKNKEERT